VQAPEPRNAAMRSTRNATSPLAAPREYLSTFHGHKRDPSRGQPVKPRQQVYGVRGNAANPKEFSDDAMRTLLKWFSRRSQRRSYRRCRDTELLAHFAIARPRIIGRSRMRATPSLL
jgi:hypothetical protein